MRYTSPQTCSHCEEEKDLEHFHFKSTGHIMRICKPCNTSRQRLYRKTKHDTIYRYNRKRHLKEKFGITLEEYSRMFEEQNGVCKICLTNDGKRMLAVDHCHNTGVVRGLLCTCCNTALGKFKDDPELLIRAVQYLEGDVL